MGFLNRTFVPKQCIDFMFIHACLLGILGDTASEYGKKLYINIPMKYY